MRMAKYEKELLWCRPYIIQNGSRSQVLRNAALCNVMTTREEQQMSCKLLLCNRACTRKKPSRNGLSIRQGYTLSQKVWNKNSTLNVDGNICTPIVYLYTVKCVRFMH